jgi:predicted nucleotidyltransferase
MQLSHPERVIAPGLEGSLLTVLAAADQAFSGRALARMVGSSVEGARQSLARLVEQGIVDREPMSTAVMYRLNRDHLVAPILLELLGIRQKFIAQVASQLATWVIPPVYGAIFGSVARGEERQDSDLDIFILRPDGLSSDDFNWNSQVQKLEYYVNRWTGCDARVLDLAIGEVAKAPQQYKVINDVIRDGITLIGEAHFLRRLVSLRNGAA